MLSNTKRILATVLFILPFLCSCDAIRFKKTTSGLKYRILKKGEGEQMVQEDWVILSMIYKTTQGKVLLDTSDEKFPPTFQYGKGGQNKDGGMQEAISMLAHHGDQIEFKLQLEKIMGKYAKTFAAEHDMEENSEVLMQVGVEKILKAEEYQAWQADMLEKIKKESKMAQERQQKQQLAKDKEVIEKYLEEHHITNAQRTDTGLYYIIEKEGNGKKPQNGNTVRVDYTGQLLNGKVFDTSLELVAKQHDMYNKARKYEPFAFQLGRDQVIQGWDEGLALLHEGTQAKLLVPSTLAYGSQAMGEDIPSNSILLFDITLVEVSHKHQ